MRSRSAYPFPSLHSLNIVRRRWQDQRFPGRQAALTVSPKMRPPMVAFRTRLRAQTTSETFVSSWKFSFLISDKISGTVTFSSLITELIPSDASRRSSINIDLLPYGVSEEFICLREGKVVHGEFLTFPSNGNRFNDQEIVALSGAHALGRCHTDRYAPFYV